MGLLQRIHKLTNKLVHDGLNEKPLARGIKDMQAQWADLRKDRALALIDEAKLRKMVDHQTGLSLAWERKAMVAIRAGRDDLARAALGRKNTYEAMASDSIVQLQSQGAVVQGLNEACQALESRLLETRRKQTSLLIRARRAQAQKRVAETLLAVNDPCTVDRLDAFEAHVDRQEAEATAGMEIAVLLGESASHEVSIRALELEDDLAELKRSLLPQGTQTALLTSGRYSPLKK